MTEETMSSKLFEQISRLRWELPTLTLLLVVLHKLLQHFWLEQYSSSVQLIIEIGFHGTLTPLLVFWVLTSIRHNVGRRETAERSLQQTYASLQETNKHLTFLVRANHRLASAKDVDELNTMLLELPLEVVPAIGSSLLLYDKQQRLLPAIHHGVLEPYEFETWINHLADPETRLQCACTAPFNTQQACPLLAQYVDLSPVKRAYCLPLKCDDRDYGFLAIYLQDVQRPTSPELVLLESLSHEMVLALESFTLRARELEMLSWLQQTFQSQDLQKELARIVEHTTEAFDAAGGLLFEKPPQMHEFQIQTVSGQLPDSLLTTIKNIPGNLDQLVAPFIVQNLNPKNGACSSLLITPLHRPNNGNVRDSMRYFLALWAMTPNAFTQRHIQLVSIVAGQVALLLENNQLYGRREYQVVLAERSRLAREIHDGLAQTLGYLKLRTTQIWRWLQNGEVGRAIPALKNMLDLLNSAYIDAREAIDGLHLKTSATNMHAWLQEIITEFENISGIPVEVTIPETISLPVEVHIQLQRIVQEALSNVRKHAVATYTSVVCRIDQEQLVMHICDDGHGFDPDDVPPSARHGTRIMKERAELLDAKFQIKSQLSQGTKVTVELPLKKYLSSR